MDFEFPRGDTKLFKFKLQDSEGKELSLTSSDRLYLTAKKSSNSTEIAFQKTLNDGIELKEDAYYYVIINSQDTASLDYGTYGFDIEVKTATGIVKTLLIGSMTLTEEFTFKGDEI